MQLLERRKDRMDLLLALLIPLKWVIIAYFVFVFVSKLLYLPKLPKLPILVPRFATCSPGHRARPG